MSQELTLCVGLILSLALLASGVIAFMARRKSRQVQGLKAWHVLCIFIFCAIFAFELSQACAGLSSTRTPLLGSLFSTIQMFLLERDIDIDESAVLGLLKSVGYPYLTYNAFLHLLAPLTTIGAALLLLSQYASLPLLWLSSRSKEVFLFSSLTSDSIVLANSVKRGVERCVVAFADVDSCEDEDLRAEARNERHLCLSQDVIGLVRWCNKRSPIRVVLCSTNETDNLHDTLMLSKALSNTKMVRRQISLHAMSEATSATSFVDSATAIAQKVGAGVQVRRINQTAALVQDLLMRYPLFLPGVLTASGDELYKNANRRLIILGSDELCYEFLKAALWCGRAHGIVFGISVYDKGAHRLARRIAYECPETHRLIGTEYDVSFADVPEQSSELLEAVASEAAHASYVLVSQADDLKSVGLARRVREVLEQARVRQKVRGAHPLMLAHVRDSQLASTLAQAQVPKGQSYDLQAVGSMDSLLSYENIFRPTLEAWGQSLNRAYWGYFDMQPGAERDEIGTLADASYEASEYNRTSSMASAIFLKYDLYSFCRIVAQGRCSYITKEQLPSSADWQLPLSDPVFQDVIAAYSSYTKNEDCTWLQRLEHDRWNAYVRTLGFECATEGDYRSFFPSTGRDQDQLARLHVCLVPFDELDEVDAMVERVEGTPRAVSFKDVDKVVIGHLSDVIGR